MKGWKRAYSVAGIREEQDIEFVAVINDDVLQDRWTAEQVDSNGQIDLFRYSGMKFGSYIV